MSRAVEESNRRMLRARGAMDRAYAEPLDIPALARLVHLSEAHFIRTFGATFGETPHRYLQRRRVERSMFMLRETGRSVTEICMAVGFSSLGTFSRTFHRIVGEPPTAYRRRTATGGGAAPAAPAGDGVRGVHDARGVPSCFTRVWTRPSSFGEAPGDRGA